MNQDKGLTLLCGTPLVGHVIRGVRELADETILVVGSEEQRLHYESVVGGDVRVVVDIYEGGSPLIGALTGLRYARGEYALMVGCDMPFISREAFELLFEEAEGSNGAVFQHPNEWIEPLHAVYLVDPSLETARSLYERGDLRVRMIMRTMADVKLVPIEVLKELDPPLLTLFDADTEGSLRKAREIMEAGSGDGSNSPQSL